jgi:hypothetical protein
MIQRMARLCCKAKVNDIIKVTGKKDSKELCLVGVNDQRT